jgi:hypothetical protein
MPRSRYQPVIFAALGVSLLSCAGKDPRTTGNEAEAATFLPNLSDFQDFHSWPSFPAGNDPVADSVHLLGPRRVYINELPPPGSSEFPVGTLIVKETQEQDVTTRDVIARAKRGGSYNADGAAGWEWWELQNTAEGKVLMLWRGVGPPVGACSYLTSVGGGCNLCHSGGTDADTVLTPALSLANFK